jgi:urease accessory protein
MLKVKRIIGNIFDNPDLAKEFESNAQNANYKTVHVLRYDLEKTRLKQKTSDGTTIGIILDDNTKMTHGDVFSENGVKILILQMPEKTITVRFAGLEPTSLVLVGHIIGNLHRPVSLGDNSISFPIHDEGEIDLFRTLFGDIKSKIELIIEDKIFQPHKSMNVHGH